MTSDFAYRRTLFAPRSIGPISVVVAHLPDRRGLEDCWRRDLTAALSGVSARSPTARFIVAATAPSSATGHRRVAGRRQSCEWILKEAAAGEVFAAGHAETGNDTSACSCRRRKAERVDGGYKFTGRKSFGSLTPVWTRLGLHGMDTSDPQGAEGRPRVPAARHAGHHDQGHVGRARHARDAQRRHRARRRIRARTRTSPASSPAGQPGSMTSSSASSRGRCSGFGNVYYGLALRDAAI